jgi:hypothetical protein
MLEGESGPHNALVVQGFEIISSFLQFCCLFVSFLIFVSLPTIEVFMNVNPYVNAFLNGFASSMALEI